MTDVVKHGVVNLNIDVVAEAVILVPLEIFTCKTLVELKLAKGFDAMVPDHVDLPSLKTLYLDSIYFYNSRYCVLEKLLSACPLLEELTILGDYWQDRKCSRIVASSTLKKLTIKCSDTCLDYWNMTLDTPSLVYLEYSDLVPRSYTIVNLASLFEAKLHLRLGWDPTNLIQGLTNVESLTIDDNSCREFFSSDHGEAIPVFINLSRLSIVFGSLFYSWEFLPLLLNKTPNLQTLAIKGPLCADYCDREYGFSSVKVLKISVYSGEIKEVDQMKRFLEKLPCLELVKVRAYAITDEEKSRITKDLLMLPRSSMCNIQIKFCDKAIIPRLRLIFGVYDNNV